jgi:hypothetical protein
MSGTVYRIHWLLGTDRLRGLCHCGAEHLSEDPIELWDWLLAHPDGHTRRPDLPPEVRSSGPARPAAVGG